MQSKRLELYCNYCSHFRNTNRSITQRVYCVLQYFVVVLVVRVLCCVRHIIQSKMPTSACKIASPGHVYTLHYPSRMRKSSSPCLSVHDCLVCIENLLFHCYRSSEEVWNPYDIVHSLGVVATIVLLLVL